MTVLLLAAAAWAQEAPEAVDYRSFVDQARFFVKREWYADAAEQLEQAVATPDGRLDPEAWFLLAKVRYELADLDGARKAADRALVNSRTPEQTEQAASLLAWLTDQFGYVHLVPPQPGMASRLDVQLRSVIFDPQLKVYFNKLTDRLEGPITLPYALGLPTGTYAINGEEVEVVAGSESTLAPRIRGGGLGLQVLELELGIGLSSWFGDATSNLLPAPTTALALSFPLGPLVVGLVGDWTVQPYEARDGSLLVAPTAWSGGGRVGYELRGTEPLVIRPSIGWRYASVAGVELGCTRTEGPFDCVIGEGAARQLYVYAPGAAQVPFVDLSVRYLDRTRRSGLGGGVGVMGSYALGTVPEADDATGLRDDVFAWTASGDRRWRAVGLRVVADLTYAF